MTVISFAPTTRRTSVARSLAAKAEEKASPRAVQGKVASDWISRIQDLVPNAELVPVLAAGAVLMACLVQIF